ncbi:MAG: GGDEF domain-containing protein [Clostridiales bacterium]|nr:GGDEF domain-containing protein [Clostridiales bacterium]
MAKLSNLLIQHELSKSEQEEFRDLVIGYNLKQTKMLTIFTIVLESVLTILYFVAVLEQNHTTRLIVFSFLAIATIGFVSIKLLEKTDKRFLKEICIIILSTMMISGSVYIACVVQRSDLLVFHIVIIAYNIMSLNKPLKAIFVSYGSFIVLVTLLYFQNSGLFNASTIVNTLAAVSLAVMVSVVAYNNRLKLFVEKRNNKIAHKKLTIMANTDQLTGLNNRRKMDAVITSQANIFARENTPLSVILMDIDHFKNINDEYGHPLGDEILVQFSNIIKHSLRYEDTAGRWGGEEFIIICRNTTCKDARMIAERLRTSISTSEFAQGISVQASFGISQMSEDMTIRELITSADRALYKAKHNGRNRVEVLDIA